MREVQKKGGGCDCRRNLSAPNQNRRNRDSCGGPYRGDIRTRETAPTDTPRTAVTCACVSREQASSGGAYTQFQC